MTLSLPLCLSLSQELERQLVEITQTQDKIQTEIVGKLVQEFMEQMETQIDTKSQEVEEQNKKVTILMFY